MKHSSKIPPRIVTAFCDYQICQCQRTGTYLESDDYYDYYICENREESGIEHTFAVLKPETQQMQRIRTIAGVSAGLILLKEGSKFIKTRVGSTTEEKQQAAKDIIEALCNNGVSLPEATKVAAHSLEEPLSFISAIPEMPVTSATEALQPDTDDVVEGGRTLWGIIVDLFT